jgi:hypothetical protein
MSRSKGGKRKRSTMKAISWPSIAEGSEHTKLRVQKRMPSSISHERDCEVLSSNIDTLQRWTERCSAAPMLCSGAAEEEEGGGGGVRRRREEEE